MHTFTCALWNEAAWKLLGLKTEELLIHSERFVDSLIEETFVWILVAFVHG